MGPILWAVHFMAVWAISELGCRANFNNVQFYTPESIRFSIFAITVLVLFFVAIGAVLALRGWRRGTVRQMDDGLETYDYLVVTGLLMSSLFLFIIFVSSMPNFILNVCDKAT